MVVIDSICNFLLLSISANFIPSNVHFPIFIAIARSRHTRTVTLPYCRYRRMERSLAVSFPGRSFVRSPRSPELLGFGNKSIRLCMISIVDCQSCLSGRVVVAAACKAKTETDYQMSYCCQRIYKFPFSSRLLVVTSDLDRYFRNIKYERRRKDFYGRMRSMKKEGL